MSFCHFAYKNNAKVKQKMGTVSDLIISVLLDADIKCDFIYLYDSLYSYDNKVLCNIDLVFSTHCCLTCPAL